MKKRIEILEKRGSIPDFDFHGIYNSWLNKLFHTGVDSKFIPQ